MLLKETYLGSSEIAGIGLFAGENIKIGEVIWKDDNRTTQYWTIEEFEVLRKTLPVTAFNNIERFAYVNKNKYCLNMDDSRFMNHSKDSNMGWNDSEVTCYAKRDISIGEELTIDYCDFCEEGDSFYERRACYKD